MSEVLVIGVSGGSGSGKTTFAELLHQEIGSHNSVLLQQDAYYHDHYDRFDFDGGAVNFDHPDAIDFELLVQHIEDLKRSRPVNVPVYDFESHSRLETTRPLSARPLVLVEGMLILCEPEVRKLLDIKVFIEAQEDIRLARRLARDNIIRGRAPEGIRRQFETHVKPMHDRFVEPSKAHADRIFSGESHVQENVRRFLSELDTGATDR